MRESEKFRKYAADCIRIASQMSGQDRQALLDIADAWETRAQDAEKKEKGASAAERLVLGAVVTAAGLLSRRSFTLMLAREV